MNLKDELIALNDARIYWADEGATSMVKDIDEEIAEVKALIVQEQQSVADRIALYNTKFGKFN